MPWEITIILTFVVLKVTQLFQHWQVCCTPSTILQHHEPQFCTIHPWIVYHAPEHYQLDHHWTSVCRLVKSEYIGLHFSGHTQYSNCLYLKIQDFRIKYENFLKNVSGIIFFKEDLFWILTSLLDVASKAIKIYVTV